MFNAYRRFNHPVDVAGTARPRCRRWEGAPDGARPPTTTRPGHFPAIATREQGSPARSRAPTPQLLVDHRQVPRSTATSRPVTPRQADGPHRATSIGRITRSGGEG